MARMLRSLAVMCVVAALAIGLGLKSGASAASFQEPDSPKKADTPDTPKTKVKTLIKKKATAKKSKAAMAEDEAATPAAADTPKPAVAAADTAGGMKFSRDIAPIISANCARCHIATHRSGFNQTTFAGLIKGGKIGNDIVPGKPEESLLIQRIKGEETPKMPPGQNQLSEGAIAKIEQWVKEGARLDAGLDASAPMTKYAASPDDLRKAELAKMSPDDRDKKTEATGLDRLKKADPKATPETSKSAHFMLFAEMPKERAANLLKTMEAQHAFLTRMLGGSSKNGMNFPEKISLYVFKERKGFTEFVRTVENQEVEDAEMARAKLSSPESPYVIAFDPLNGGPDPADAKGASSKAAPKKTRAKKSAVAAEENFSGAERTVAGLLTEQLAAGAMLNAGKPPRWMTLGVGALIASRIEPRSPYYKRIRAEAADQAARGWATLAQEALGNQTKPEAVRAVGFAVGDWLLANDASAFAMFMQKMLEGEAKLDDAIQGCLNSNREAFLSATESYVSSRYSRSGR